jgi:hypothetical protein
LEGGWVRRYPEEEGHVVELLHKHFVSDGVVADGVNDSLHRPRTPLRVALHLFPHLNKAGLDVVSEGLILRVDPGEILLEVVKLLLELVAPLLVGLQSLLQVQGEASN